VKRFVLDASVVVKWFLPEIHQVESFDLLKSNPVLIAPEFLKVEFDSILSKWCRSGRLNYERAEEVRSVFKKIKIYFIGLDDIADISFEVSAKLPVTYYDALYLCTAKFYECKMVTFDRKLLKSVEGSEFDTYLEKL